MPNGGTHHCAQYCRHFDNTRRICSLRNISIEEPFCTSCHDFNKPVRTPSGPMLSIVCQVRAGGGGYATIPYFYGNRLDAVQAAGSEDTVVQFLE